MALPFYSLPEVHKGPIFSTFLPMLVLQWLGLVFCGFFFKFAFLGVYARARVCVCVYSSALILKPNVIPCDLFPLNMRSIGEDTKKAKYQHDLSSSCTQIAS